MIKKPKILFIGFVLIASFMSSCVEEYSIRDDDFESKLVVNALFENGSPWSVVVSNTSDIFDPETETERIDFAKVEIYDQNDKFLYELYHQEDGRYAREDYGPSPKRGYSIKVSATGYHPVTAKSFVPEKSILQINNFSIIPNDIKDDVMVDFEIQDKSQLESYYLWEVVCLNEDSDGETSSSANQLSQTWINELTNNPNALVNTDRKFLGNGSFGDGTYQGTYNSTDGNRRIGNTDIISNSGYTSNELEEELTSNILTTDPTIGDPNEVVNDIDMLDNEGTNINEEDVEKEVFKYELRVMTISKELYNYYSSLEQYYQNGGNNHSNQAPPQIYTNVKNGAGIFAGLSESVIQF